MRWKALLFCLLLGFPAAAQNQTVPDVAPVTQTPPPGVPASGTPTPLPGPFALGDTSGNFNIGAPQLNHWRKAVANVRAGLGRGRLIFVGDSTTLGTGAGTGGLYDLNAAYPKSFPSALSVILGNFVSTSFNSLAGFQQGQVAYATYDVRATLGANWANSSSESLGAGFFQYTSGAVNNLSFAPAGAFDTIVVYYYSSAPAGSATVNVDGGSSLGALTTGGTQTGAKSLSVTTTKGTHTVNVVPDNNGTLYVDAIVTYDSTTPAIDIIQGGHFGAKIVDLVNDAGSAAFIPLQKFAPDLTIINCTINDSNAGTSLSSYTTNMQSLITEAELTGDVLLMVGPPSNTTAATNGTLNQYIAVLRQLAISNNIGLLNIAQRWTSYAVTNPLMPYFDTLHPEAAGYQDIGSALAGVLQ